MAVIKASEFYDWQRNPVTIAFMYAARERVKDGMHVLATTAGMDSVADNYMRGFIAAYNELEDFRIEDLDGETDE
jgi:hypothetical protein